MTCPSLQSWAGNAACRSVGPLDPGTPHSACARRGHPDPGGKRCCGLILFPRGAQLSGDGVPTLQAPGARSQWVVPQLLDGVPLVNWSSGLQTERQMSGVLGTQTVTGTLRRGCCVCRLPSLSLLSRASAFCVLTNSEPVWLPPARGPLGPKHLLTLTAMAGPAYPFFSLCPGDPALPEGSALVLLQLCAAPCADLRP